MTDAVDVDEGTLWLARVGGWPYAVTVVGREEASGRETRFRLLDEGTGLVLPGMYPASALERRIATRAEAKDAPPIPPLQLGYPADALPHACADVREDGPRRLRRG